MYLARDKTPRGVVPVLPESSFPPDKSTPGAIRGGTARGLDLIRDGWHPKVELYERISLRVDLCVLERHGA
jgi:hypothetical protein